ncbi:M23 family metallopeptidase [Actinoplanes sp. TBRC 11911]|uniref:M23 family metallopeptidase n=1 Tax=Actinoplanes sp. TBRC 11911 TaxID=2729386 RepID=UPI00145D6F3E|nr:peptidoglycan DD-metalloendopeptidase family protein [Actinoplanes sp. TBRC 11911]NMO53813.1 M23 family metallopeptidase [Actinoplanes sp. TBRC 11911]
MRVLGVFTGLTVAAALLAGCGGTGTPTATPTPRFAAAAESPAPVPSFPPDPVRSGAAKPESTAVSPSAPTAKKVAYVFPVKTSNADWHTTHSGYKATDIFADCGQPVVATTSGVVLEISLKDIYQEGAPDGPNNGGLSVSLLGDDGVRYYGSHLSKVQDGIKAGVRVTAGQPLGKVGHTGNASGVCHLHYGISPPCAKVGDWKVRRGVVWPYPYLDSWRKGGQKSPVAEVTSWEKAHACKA